MSYEHPDRRMYSFGNFDFGAAADEQFVVEWDKGKAARLYDYGVFAVREVMNGNTVTPKVAVGTSSDPDAYGEELDINAVAVNKSYSVRTEYDEIADATSFDALMVDRDLPADTPVYVTCTGATGAPTGQACPFVIIDVDW